jgi:fimbrial chaperone protein
MQKMHTDRFMKRVCFQAAMVALFAFIATPAFSAEFSVNPTLLELSGGAKSGVFSVINSGSDKLNCQIDVKEWAQDENGKDMYWDTKDIVFFPKIMTVEPNEQRAVRIGFKAPPGMKEKTYRIFVEEIPTQKKAADGKKAGKITAGLTIAFRYSMPIFVKPIRPQESGVIDTIDLSKGVASAVVRNTGNVHLKLQSVTFRGKASDGAELFSQDVSGWYVLHGLSRRFETNVPKELCKNLATIEVSGQTENISLNGTLNVQRNMCAP